MQSKQMFKIGIMVIALSALAACRSSGDAEEAADSSASSEAARPAAAPSTSQLSQEEIRAQNALRQTVFYFDFDIAEFKAEDRQTLTYHARDLAANPNKRIRLEGHADERGTREYNLALGERRANGILNYLVVNGAARGQIEVVSYGEERPAQTGQTEQAYGRNRRVEVVAP